MINCPNCGRENDEDYKYCLGCGSVLPRAEEEQKTESDEIQCPHCGTAVPRSFKFCGACGGPISEAAAPKRGGGAAAPEARQPETPKSAAPKPAAPEPAAPEEEPEIVGELVVIKPDGTEGARVPLTADEVVLGRSSDYDVLANDPFLSPQHAVITSKNGHFEVRDPGSLNGVFVRISKEVELQDGDFIRLGQELLHFRLMSELDPVTGRPEEEKTLIGGSPDTGFWGRLALVSGPELVSRAFVFSDDEVTIGREIGDVLFREDGFVSGKHARLAKVEGKVFLKDLGSSNGTYIRIHDAVDITAGDLILMGQQLFRLEVRD